MADVCPTSAKFGKRIAALGQLSAKLVHTRLLLLHGGLPNHREELGEDLLADFLSLEEKLVLLPCLLGASAVDLEPGATRGEGVAEDDQHVDPASSFPSERLASQDGVELIGVPLHVRVGVLVHRQLVD